MRNRILAYILVVCLALVLSFPPRQVSAFDPQQPGRLERAGGIAVAYVQGDPYHMGLQQGALWRSELRSLVRDYLHGRLILDDHISHFWLLSQARLLEPTISDSMRQEIRGIADGAGLSYQDVLLLNTIPDLQALARRVPSPGLFPALFSGPGHDVSPARSPPGAVFAGWGRATTEGKLLVGYTLEYADSDLLQHDLVLTVRQPAEGNSSVSLAPAGMVGTWAGTNEEKMVVALCSSPSTDVAASGQPLPFLLRQVLEKSGSLDEAVSLLLSAERLYGGNVMLGDGKAPQGIALELSAHRHALFDADTTGDILLRTNHFLNTELALTQQASSAEEMAASRMRMERLRDVLESNQGWIGTDKALAFLVEMNGGSPGETADRGASQGVLLDPFRLALWVVQGNADVADAPYVRLDLTSALLGD